MLFSDRSVWTMVHGIVFGGGALLALSAVLYHLCVVPAAADQGDQPRQGRALSLLLATIAVLLWMTVIGGTYVVFPFYRATPPEGLTELARYPRALVMSDPGTRWLQTFAMEIKDHMPWIAAMLATAAAYVGVRYRSRLSVDATLRGIVTALSAIGFALVALVALLGVFVNKVAPVE
jgi:hypothetical protein